MLMAPHTSAAHAHVLVHIASSIDDVQLHYVSSKIAAPDHDLQDASPSGSCTSS